MQQRRVKVLLVMSYTRRTLTRHENDFNPKNESTVNLKSASFIVIMLSHEGLTHIHSQIKPRLLFGESFTLKMISLFAATAPETTENMLNIFILNHTNAFHHRTSASDILQA